MIYRIGDQVVLRPDLSQIMKDYYRSYGIYLNITYTIESFKKEGPIYGDKGPVYKLAGAGWVSCQDVLGSFEENLKKILE